MLDRPLRFGVFYAPFHPVGQSPTLALEYDLERVAELDRLGYDEAWFGEHHSGGYELISCPEIFIAAAAERTRNIKLGTGVVSLPYHHPWMRSYRLIAREVIPHFKRQLASPRASHDWATAKRNELFGRAGQAIMNAIVEHVDEKKAAGNGAANTTADRSTS